MSVYLSTDELKRYLYGVFEIELSVYIQKNSISKLTQKYNSLGLRKNIHYPSEPKLNFQKMDKMISVGWIIAIISAVVAGIVEYCMSSGNIFSFIGSIIIGAIYGAFGFVAGALTIGVIVGLICVYRENKNNKLNHQILLKKYEKAISDDKKRVAHELIQKKALLQEINELKVQLNRTRQNLEKLYNVNILAEEYRNIFAVSSIYGYFTNGRTKSLWYNDETGDQGAYNIYESERRLDKLIMNTDEILRSLDKVIYNQYELANGLRNASLRIENLCKNVSSHLKHISNEVDSVSRCQNIIAYNSECIARENELLKWIMLY